MFNQLKEILDKKYSLKIDSNQIADFLFGLKYDDKMNLELGVESLLLKDYKDFDYALGKFGYAVFNLQPLNFFNSLGVQ